MRMVRAGLLGLGLPFALGAAEPVALTVDVGPDAYPAEALAQKLEGEVLVTLQITAAGEIRCAASGGSAPAALRRPSCELLVARNVFAPAVQDGNVAASEFRLAVRWNLQGDGGQFGGALPIARKQWLSYADYPPIAANQMLTGKVDVAFDISEQGRAEDCKVTRSNATSALSGEICPLVVRRAIFLPAVTAEGVPKRTRGWLKTQWRWPGECKAKGCGSPDAGA